MSFRKQFKKSVETHQSLNRYFYVNKIDPTSIELQDEDGVPITDKETISREIRFLVAEMAKERGVEVIKKAPRSGWTEVNHYPIEFLDDLFNEASEPKRVFS